MRVIACSVFLFCYDVLPHRTCTRERPRTRDIAPHKCRRASHKHRSRIRSSHIARCLFQERVPHAGCKLEAANKGSINYRRRTAMEKNDPTFAKRLCFGLRELRSEKNKSISQNVGVHRRDVFLFPRLHVCERTYCLYEYSSDQWSNTNCTVDAAEILLNCSRLPVRNRTCGISIYVSDL
jgi:hypothetical protein